MTQPPTEKQSPAEDPRVRFAAERTLLAWIRTALALMGFGFVVARFGLFLREVAVTGHVLDGVRSTGLSLWIGTALIGLGIAISLLASAEYWHFARSSAERRTYIPRTGLLAVVVALVLAALGLIMAVHLIVISL